MPDLDRLADRKLATTVADGGRLRALLLELWQRTRMDWGFVTDRLAQTFRKETWIGAHERRFVSETLYGLVRHLRRVDLALERGRRVKKPPRDLERLLALLVLEKLIDAPRAAKVVDELDWNAVAGVDEVIAGERRADKRIALAHSLPDWLATRLVADWGDEAEPLAAALNARAPMTVRANTLVTSRDALHGELAKEGLTSEPGRWSDTALIVTSRTNVFASAAFKRGAIEAQDEGSQLLGELATPGKLIVDYCAGAGGKTLAIAARLGNRGRIIATDVDTGKLEELRRRARRAGVSNVQAMSVDDRQLDAVRGKADVVFVDAPCSGIGALRRNPEARWRLREQDIAGFAAKQKEIMRAALELAAPGARVVYATCSLLSEENERVAESLPCDPLPLADVLGARATGLSRGDAFTVAPHTHGTDGFFARTLRAR
ncbi:MAG: RsmB/NOP family class I SAM-dependent RNA methyltransferase [Deltaproteobacteria bacterium]|nr:RsmB/NOP family class I SAM-dependent RNA methyltransferase [Deltaproteobacteria bacterium]